MRVDPIVGRQVLIAEDRASRPNDYLDSTPPIDSQAIDGCPFCAGNEKFTPKEMAVSYDQHGNWQVRVVPNKFPAVSFASVQASPIAPNRLDGQHLAPEGAHEVIIDSPNHVQDITELSQDEFEVVLKVYRDRVKRWSEDKRIASVTLFKNVGQMAGASLQHIHSQLLALPGIPVVLNSELQACRKHFESEGMCLFCKIIEQERAAQSRWLATEGPFVAFCAYAGRQPFESWILPSEHHPGFEQLADTNIPPLASLLQRIVQRLRCQLVPLSYNLILHTSPFRVTEAEHFHWHLELVPRSTRLAGFEWGTGMHINPLSPERAAESLRQGQFYSKR